MASFLKGLGRQVSESSAATTVKKELVDEKKNIQNQVQAVVSASANEIDSKVNLLIEKLAEKEAQLNTLKGELANRDDLASRIEQTIQAILADDIEKDKQIDSLRKQLSQKKVESDILKDQLVKLSSSSGKQTNNTEQQKLIQTLTQENNQLKQQLSASSTSVIDDEIFQKVKEAMEERDSLSQKLKESEASNIQLSSQISNYRTMQEQWIETQNSLQQKVLQLQASNDAEKIRELESKLEDSKRKENSLNFKITELKNQLEDPKHAKALSELEEKYEALVKESQVLNLQVQEKEQHIANKEDEISRLAGLKASSENREKELLDQINQLKEVVAAFQSSPTTPSQPEEDTSEQQEANSPILSEDEWKSKYDELLKQYSRLLLERTSFNEKLQATDNQLIDLESKVNRLTEDLRKSQERERYLGDSNSKLKERISELGENLRQAETKAHSFHEQIIELQSVKIQLEEISEQHSHLSTEKTALEEKLSHTEQSLLVISKELQEANNKIKEFQTSYVPSHEVEIVQERVKELEAKLVDQQFSFPVPDSNLEDQKKIQDLSDELQRARQENQDLREQHSLQKERIDSLKKREQDATQPGDELKKTIKNLESEKEENAVRFMSQIDRLSTQIADLQKVQNKHTGDLQTVKSCIIKLVETQEVDKVIPILSGILRLTPEEQAAISKLKGKKKK